MNKDTLIQWLSTNDPAQVNALWQQADQARQKFVGDEIHLRGLIEISNHCVRQCTYCGLHAKNRDVTRYRMNASEILGSARLAKKFGYGTVVMQAGEDFGFSGAAIADVIRQIKDETGLAVTLSLGERNDDFASWRKAGADRFLIRFEASNPALYQRIHPDLPGKVSDRFDNLKALRKLGFEIGSGVMVGLPGQTMSDLADDLLAMQALDLDMIGIGPYVPHPDTPLGREFADSPTQPELAMRMIALARILCPEANIPSTTAITTLAGSDGRTLGLQRGANILMPNLTPEKYRKLYQIYPSKAGSFETSEESDKKAKDCIKSIGRTIGTGPGFRPKPTNI